MSRQRIFVYGTLKQGFRNHAVLKGTRLAGDFITVQAYPLYVIGPFGLPWLVHAPGQGHSVVGQVFEVDAAGLAALDVLERVADPHWYARQGLEVRPLGGGDPIGAQAYFGAPERVSRETVHHGPLADYTLDHQALYRRHL